MAISRREFIQQSALLPALLSGCGGGGGGGADVATNPGSGPQSGGPTGPATPTGATGPVTPTGALKKPNVLVICIDDLNDWVGFLGGHPQVKTPNLDALARQSTVFRRAYCNAPVCNPSRSSAWSGLSVQDTKVFDNNTDVLTVTPRAVLLPYYLAENGYESHLLGKVFHSYEGPTDPVPATVPASNKTCSGYPTTPTQGLFDWAALDLDDSAMADYQNVQSAQEFLARQHNSPFMLTVGMLRTHVGWYVPKKYFDQYPLDSIQVPNVPANDLDDLPWSAKANALQFQFHRCITSQGLWASAVQAYLASISFVDAQIGRLLAALRASPHADNTMVVLWSDNGFHLGEKFHWHKLALWEPATRIPFVIRLPGQTQGNTVDAPVSLIDMMPTMLDYCGVAEPYAMAGRSLRPVIENPATPWEHPVLTTKDQKNHAIRTSRWRYIRYANGDQELYDALADPHEWTNLAKDPAQAQVIAQLDALMPAP